MAKEKKEVTVSLDIGSNSIHGLIACETDGKLEIISADTVQSEGIKNGIINGIQEATNSVNILIEKLLKNHEEDIAICRIVTALRGKTTAIVNKNEDIKMKDDDTEITEETISKLKTRCSSSSSVMDGHELIQIIPREYVLDKQEGAGIYDPVGMNCKVLSLNALLVTVPKNNIQSIEKVVNSQIDNMLYGYAVICDSLITKADKEIGCILIDIGDTTTGIVVYKDTKIITAFEIEIGSYYITRDIYKILKTTDMHTAQEIKENCGSVFYDSAKDETFEYINTSAKTVTFSKKQLSEIIKTQVDLQIDFILNTLKKKNIVPELLFGGVILTGGGSKLEGMQEAFEKGFNSIVKVANFNGDNIVINSETKDIVNSQIYTTAIAAFFKDSKDSYIPVKNYRKDNGSWFSRLKDSIKDMF